MRGLQTSYSCGWWTQAPMVSGSTPAQHSFGLQSLWFQHFPNFWKNEIIYNLNLVILTTKTAISPIFPNFWRNRTLQPPSRLQLEFSNFSCKNCNFSRFFFAIFGEIAEIAVLTGNPSTFFSLYHLSVILEKTAISPIFRNFCYCVQTWTYLKKGDYSNEDNVLPQRFLFDDLNYSLRQICTLSPSPLPAKSRTGKWRVLAFARLHPWFGEGGWKFDVPFYSVQDCSPLSSSHHCLVFENSWENGQRTGHDFYPLKIFHLFGFPSWKSCDPKIIGIKTYLFKNFSQKKCSQKF